MLGPCETWITAADVFGCTPCSAIAEGERDATLALRVAEAASEWLYVQSGRRFSGGCDVEVRPCCACSYDTCGCMSIPTIVLPGVVASITQVRIDGAVLAASAYRVDERRYLVRIDGQPWPVWQDLRNDPASDEHTFQINYVRGIAPPELGTLAAQELACELYRGCATGDCAIPAQVTNLVRQGTSISLIKPEDIGFDQNGNLKTGMRQVSLFLAAFGARRGRASIASPDVDATLRHV